MIALLLAKENVKGKETRGQGRVDRDDVGAALRGEEKGCGPCFVRFTYYPRQNLEFMHR